MGLPPTEGPKPGYRPGVGVMLVNRQGFVFVGQRIDTTAEAWQMPQGGIDPGEDPQTTAMRELEEEIGTAKACIFAETEGWLNYDLPPRLQGKVWNGKWPGQTQKWYAALFRGRDEDIDLQTDHPEFNDWRWVRPEDLTALIVPFKRPLYQMILADLQPKVEAKLSRVGTG